MNGYERREALRNKALAERRKKTRDRNFAEKMLEVNALIKRYEEAYFTYHQRTVKVTYLRGWFTVHNRKVREVRLVEMARNLESLAHEQDLLHPEVSQ